MTESTTHLNQRRLVVEEKASARAELLSGKATASHRPRINEARQTARETLTKAREARSSTAGAFQSAGARCEETASGLGAAKSCCASAKVVFNTACQNPRILLGCRVRFPH
ncbi:MAG: exonuclease SbcC [Rhodospirillaceae bacterium]|nr:MAG: exonuclease SbcC [Rhodospirillaceae bacterium]